MGTEGHVVLGVGSWGPRGIRGETGETQTRADVCLGLDLCPPLSFTKRCQARGTAVRDTVDGQSLPVLRGKVCPVPQADGPPLYDSDARDGECEFLFICPQ